MGCLSSRPALLAAEDETGSRTSRNPSRSGAARDPMTQTDPLEVVVSEEALTAKGITVKAHAFTDSARQAIEGAGGKCITLSPTTDQPLEAAA